jgi:hypothetical protein
MNYHIKSVETVYSGVTFRSRLEAKWAAMFDLLNWRWEYEPLEFDGWFPDFVIIGKKQVFVEVKPLFDFPHDVAEKINGSSCPYETLIVGASCPIAFSTFTEDHPSIGWLSEVCGDEWRYWDSAPFGRWRDGKGKIGFCHSSYGFDDRITGGYDGGSFGGLDITWQEVRDLWGQACSRVQWKKRVR